MDIEDAIELGRRSIYHATFRDAVSGGTVSGASALLASTLPGAPPWGLEQGYIHDQRMSSKYQLTHLPVSVQSIM